MSTKMELKIQNSPEETLKSKQDAAQARISVLLPDMFVSFLAQKPRVNPHYESVKNESELWINGSILLFPAEAMEQC